MSFEERFSRQTSGALHALPLAGGLYQLRITALKLQGKMINDSKSALCEFLMAHDGGRRRAWIALHGFVIPVRVQGPGKEGHEGH